MSIQTGYVVRLFAVLVIAMGMATESHAAAKKPLKRVVPESNDVLVMRTRCSGTAAVSR